MTDHVAGELSIQSGDGVDGARGGAHAARDAGAFERGAGGGRGAENPIAIAENDLAVGAEIHHGGQIGGFMQTSGKDAGKDVAADKSAKIGQEPNARISWQFPAERAGGEDFKVEPFGFKRAVGERLEIESTEQMMHDGVPGNDHMGEMVGQTVDCVDHFRDHFAELLADEPGKHFGLAAGELDAAHDIGAVLGLQVQGSADGEDMAGGEVEQLGDDGCGAQIDGDPETGLRGEREGRVIGQDRDLPLGEFKLEVSIGLGAAGEAPAGVEFGEGESIEVVG